MNIFQGMIIAFSMYSKIPMPHIKWTKENMRFSMCFFPLVGLVIAVFLYGWYCLSDFLKVGNLLRSIVFVIIPIIITGGIHLDGFLDTVDAISSYQTMERRLEILKDSNSGAFAIIYGIVYIVLQIGVWSEILMLMQKLDKELSLCVIKILMLTYLFSRALSGLSITTLKCAKNSGLAATFSSMADRDTAKVIMALITVYVGSMMVCINSVIGIAAAAAGGFMFLIYVAVSYRKFGGITGDLAGFFLQMCELIMEIAILIVMYVFLHMN